jgi:hypothetical protein
MDVAPTSAATVNASDGVRGGGPIDLAAARFIDESGAASHWLPTRGNDVVHNGVRRALVRLLNRIKP